MFTEEDHQDFIAHMKSGENPASDEFIEAQWQGLINPIKLELTTKEKEIANNLLKEMRVI